MSDTRVRLRHTNGATVLVPSERADRLVASGAFSAEGAVVDDGGYQSMKVADLKAEIARRNADRDEADRISTDGKKADLVAALEADDEDSGEGNDEGAQDGGSSSEE